MPFPKALRRQDIRDILLRPATTEGVVTYNAILDRRQYELLLRPGMTATVSVVTRQGQDDVLTVPNAAFRYSPPRGAAETGFEPAAHVHARMARGARRPPKRDTAARTTRTIYHPEGRQAAAVSVKAGASDGELTRRSCPACRKATR
jgi:HlyD family secretion protein